MPPLLRQISRFASVGVAATGLHVATALALNSAFGVAPLRANFIAFLVAMIASYFPNWLWTFETSSKLAHSAPKYVAVNLASFGLNQAIVYAVTTPWQKPMWLAMVVVVAIIPALNFVLGRALVFKPATLA